MTTTEAALRETLKEIAKGVFVDAATQTHYSWIDGTNGREPDFGEAASDYAESFADAYVEQIAALSQPSPASSTAGEVRDCIAGGQCSMQAMLDGIMDALDHAGAPKAPSDGKRVLGIYDRIATLSPSSGEPASVAVEADLRSIRNLAKRCADLAKAVPVAGEPDPHWWDRQSALGDAADWFNVILAATFPKPGQPAAIDLSAERERICRLIEAAEIAPIIKQNLVHDILALSKPTPVEAGLREALAKIMPIRVHDGPDYAEVYFADGSTHSTQAMTMNPQDWIAINDAFTALSETLPVEREA